VASDFREVQPIRQWWITVLLLVPCVVTLTGSFQQLILGRPWGTRPLSNLPFALIEAGLIGFAVWIHLVRLETEVRNGEPVIRYRGLWPTRRIPLSEIVKARSITYRPIVDYGGFGVRWGWDGSMIFNARGDRGVEIIPRNGKRIVVASQRPADLERAIGRP
jgi:hypothetical protein